MGFFVGVMRFEVRGQSGQVCAQVYGVTRISDETVERGVQLFVDRGNFCVLAGEPVEGGLQFGEVGGEAREDAVLA